VVSAPEGAGAVPAVEDGAGASGGRPERADDAPPASDERKPRYEEGMNFGAVLRATQGHRDDLPPPPDFDVPPADLAERCHRALYEVADPEFPVSLVDLGLVYDVDADEAAGSVTVRLTFTATACPCMDFITWDVRERLMEEPDVEEVAVEVVWDPPWTTARISERGRRALAKAGVAV
jgi:metal-sulfur cluster biosynthetic enzyme